MNAAPHPPILSWTFKKLDEQFDELYKVNNAKACNGIGYHDVEYASYETQLVKV